MPSTGSQAESSTSENTGTTSTTSSTPEPTPEYTPPKLLQPSSYEEDALEAIAKISVWVTAISTVVGALVVLIGAVPGLQQALKRATKAFL